MITFSVLSDSAVKLTFDGNSHYLQDGEITVPKNSLALVKDESELITFIKAATGDAYLSFHIEDTNFASYTELENWYKSNMVSAYGGGGGGGGVTSGEVQTMIDNSISGKADTSAVTSAVTEITDALEDKVDVSELEEVELAVAQSINVLAQSVSGKQDTLQYITEDTEEGFVDINVEYENQYYGATIGGGSVLLTSDNLNDVSDPSNRLYGTALDIYADGVGLTSTEKWYDSENGEWVEESGVHELQSKEDGLYVDGEKIATVPMLNNKADASSVYTKTEVDTAFGMAMNSLHSLSGEVAAYSAATDAALSGKQDALVAGAGIAINGNVISATGGGGGGNASITSVTQAQYEQISGSADPSTLYVISDAPAVDISNYYTKTEVDDLLLNVEIDVDTAITQGSTNAVEGGAIYDALQGKANTGTCYSEMQTRNTSNGTALELRKGTGFSWGTLATIGSINGTKIATDTDFSLVSKSAIITSMTSSSTDAEVPSAKAVYDAMGGLTLLPISQADYDLLPTKDPNTLYIITNVVNNS